MTAMSPSARATLSRAAPSRGGKGAQAYLDQLRRLGAPESEIAAARDASKRRARALLRRFR
jgi:hypothetical protein